MSFPYPLPLIDQLLSSLEGATLFSVADLSAGFHQILLRAEDRPKTAFTTPWGRYHFIRMPFGLKNVPATFQQQMNRIIPQSRGKFVYIDDVILTSADVDAHIDAIRTLAKDLRRANLKLKPSKCQFLKKSVTFLGHVISSSGTTPSPGKVEQIQKFPQPRTIRDVKAFLGKCLFYSRYIPKFSCLARPLNDLLIKDMAFKWEERQDHAFSQMKGYLSSKPMLRHPNYDDPFFMATFVQAEAIGSVLVQNIISGYVPISLTSSSLTSPQQRYSVADKEVMAMLYCARQFNHYVYGRRFTFMCYVLWCYPPPARAHTSRLDHHQLFRAY